MIPSYGADGLAGPDGLDDRSVASSRPLTAGQAASNAPRTAPGRPLGLRVEPPSLDPAAAVALHTLRYVDDLRRPQRDSRPGPGVV